MAFVHLAFGLAAAVKGYALYRAYKAATSDDEASDFESTYVGKEINLPGCAEASIVSYDAETEMCRIEMTTAGGESGVIELHRDDVLILGLKAREDQPNNESPIVGWSDH